MSLDRLITDEEMRIGFPGMFNAPIVVNDHKIADFPDSQLPQSPKNRKPPGTPPTELERMVRDHVCSASHPDEALDAWGHVLDSLSRQLGLVRMGPADDGAGINTSQADTASGDATAGVILQVLDGLDKVNRSAGGKSAQVTREARRLLETICTTIRNRGRSGLGESNTGGDEGDGYREASPAFAAMNLNRRQRGQSDADADRIVDEMFSRKWPASHEQKIG